MIGAVMNNTVNTVNTVNAVNAVNARTATAGATPSTPATSNDSMGKDMFLKLLVAQLKYQDPLKPTNGSEFVQQTSQLSMVEKLEDLLRATNASAVSNAAVAATGLVGRTVEYKNAADASAMGAVSAVRFDRTGPILVVGKDEIPLSSVLQVLASTR